MCPDYGLAPRFFGRTLVIKLVPKADPSSGLRAWPTTRDAFHWFPKNFSRIVLSQKSSKNAFLSKNSEKSEPKRARLSYKAS